jgi:hypothetical protein
MVSTVVVKDNYDENTADVQDTGTDIAFAVNMNRKIAKFQLSTADTQNILSDDLPV